MFNRKLFLNPLDVSQTILKIIRQRPGDGKAGTVVSVISLVLAAGFIVLTIFYFANIHGNVDSLAEATESLTTYMQTFIKMFPLLLYRKKLQRLFNLMEFFWDPETFPELIPGIQRLYRNTYYFCFAYQSALYSTLLFFYVQPFFKLELLVVGYIPPVPGAFWIMLGLQYPFAMVISSAMGGFDTMYVSLFKHLSVQLKLLKYAIENIDIDSSDFPKIFEKYIEHHKFILSFADELLKIVGFPLLGQYVISTFLTCMELYLLSNSLESPMRVGLGVCYTTSLLFQFGCYCFTATDFTEEAGLIGEAAYFSRWYSGTASQRKMMSFLILRAQRDVICTAAGLVNIDQQAFMTVLKTAISFYTLMRQFSES